MIRLKDLLLEQAAKPNVTMTGPTVLRGAERLKWETPAGFWHVEYSPDIPMILRKNGEDDRTKLTTPGTLSETTGSVSFIVRKNVTADGGITNIQLNKISDRKYALKISVNSGNSRKPGKSDAKVELSGFVPGYSYVIYDEDDNSHLLRFIVKDSETVTSGETGSEEKTVTSGAKETELETGTETKQIGITTKSDDYKVGEKLFKKYGDDSVTLPADSVKKALFGNKVILQYYDRVITRNPDQTAVTYQSDVEDRNLEKIHGFMMDKVKKYIKDNIQNIQIGGSATIVNLGATYTEEDNQKLPLYDKNQNIDDPIYYINKKSNYATYQYKQQNNGHWSDIVTVGHTIITLTPNKIKPAETEA